MIHIYIDRAIPVDAESLADGWVITGEYKIRGTEGIWHMSIDSKKFSERHRKFENKISDDTYKSLEKLYNIVVGQETSSANLNLSKKITEDKKLVLV